jgi:hypothetical protein
MGAIKIATSFWVTTSPFTVAAMPLTTRAPVPATTTGSAARGENVRGKALKEAVISKLRRAICFIEYGNLLLIGVRGNY